MTLSWNHLLIAEFMTILLCGAYLQHGYRKAIRLTSPLLFWMGYVYGAVILFAALAVALNLATSTEASPGARLLTGLLAPLALFCVVAMAYVLQQRRR